MTKIKKILDLADTPSYTTAYMPFQANWMEFKIAAERYDGFHHKWPRQIVARQSMLVSGCASYDYRSAHGIITTDRRATHRSGTRTKNLEPVI